MREPHLDRGQHPQVDQDQPQEQQVVSERLTPSDTETPHNLEILPENKNHETPAKPPHPDKQSDQNPQPQTELRRSMRASKPPDRLNIESFKGQSYSSENLTACQSVADNHLLPVRPGGGEGITGVRQSYDLWRPWLELREQH